MDKSKMLFNEAMNLNKQGSAPRSRIPPFSSEATIIGSGPSLETQASLEDSEVMILPQPTRRTQCRWDDDMVKSLVELMLFVVTTYGKRSDNGNKKEVHQYVASEMNKKVFHVSKHHVANKLKQLKKEYNVALETKKKVALLLILFKRLLKPMVMYGLIGLSQRREICAQSGFNTSMNMQSSLERTMLLDRDSLLLMTHTPSLTLLALDGILEHSRRMERFLGSGAQSLHL